MFPRSVFQDFHQRHDQLQNYDKNKQTNSVFLFFFLFQHLFQSIFKKLVFWFHESHWQYLQEVFIFARKLQKKYNKLTPAQEMRRKKKKTQQN